MYPQVVQFETRQLHLERELRFARERTRSRASLETHAKAMHAGSQRLRALARGARWGRRAAHSES